MVSVAQKYNCAGCQIQCSQIYNDKNGKYLTSGFEYETIWGLGANCCIEDLDDIVRLSTSWTTSAGTASTAVMFGVAMEAGILLGDGGRSPVARRDRQGTPLAAYSGGGAGQLGVSTASRASRWSRIRAFRRTIRARSRASA